MAYGGGIYKNQNKILPGTYQNFTSAAKADASLSERGIAAAPFVLNWGAEDVITEVTAKDFYKNSITLFGYDYRAPEMLNLREMFCHATKVLCYRLGTGAVKAACKHGTAKYGGTRGNALRIVIAANVDDDDKFDVSTYLDNLLIDKQTVESASELTDNNFITFDKTEELAATSGIPLTGGTNVQSITGTHHQAFINKLENYSFNALCCPATESSTVALYESFTKRMREEIGTKFQLAAWQALSNYEGVVGVWNTVTNADSTNALVYWITGALAGVAVNKSLTNAEYDGELTVNVNYTQAELESCITAGKFVFHNANGTVRVLEDINTLVNITDEKADILKYNQTVRVCDQIANDIAVMFNTRYIGIVPNDTSGRVALWNDTVKILQELESIRAIENFSPDAVTVNVGDSKKSVELNIDGITVINAMSQLYMNVIIG